MPFKKEDVLIKPKIPFIKESDKDSTIIIKPKVKEGFTRWIPKKPCLDIPKKFRKNNKLNNFSKTI